MMKIPFKKINLGNALERITPLIESGHIGLGNTVFEMENKLAKYVGAKYVVAVDSCTSALFLSLLYEKKRYKITKVSIPSMTVPLVPNAVLEAGLDMEFNDATDWVGSAYRILDSNVYDSAHQLQRNQYKNMLGLGAPSRMKLCFSFYPTKTIGSADGGAIATNDQEFADWVRCVSTYGRNQGKHYGNSWDYDVVTTGYKRHYTNLQAAIVLEQLERLDETNENRQKIVRRYNKAFNLYNTSDYLYRLRIFDRDAFVHYMADRGIECGVHFKPVHLMEPFKYFSVRNREKIEDEYKYTVSLPLYDTMTDDEIDYVIRCTKDWVDKPL